MRDVKRHDPGLPSLAPSVLIPVALAVFRPLDGVRHCRPYRTPSDVQDAPAGQNSAQCGAGHPGAPRRAAFPRRQQRSCGGCEEACRASSS